MTVIAMAAVGITAVMLAVQFKALKGEYGIYLTAAACLFIFSYGIRRMDTTNGINIFILHSNIDCFLRSH